MKNILFLVFTVLLSNPILIGQHHSKCSHAYSFEKKEISDTLEATWYKIHLNELDFTNHEITAWTEIELLNKVDNLSQVTLELQDLSVDEVWVDNISVAGFTHEGMILKIPLTSTINTGESVIIKVEYHGEPFHEAWGGFHWAGQYAFNLGVGFESIPHNLGKTWFPCIDDFRDRATYELFVTVTNGKDAVCGGLLQGITNNGNGTSTYHWTLDQPIPTYLASVAVGDYAKWTDTYNGIEEDIPVEIWTRPSDSGNVDGSFQNLNEILAIYEDKFGPYRWDRVGYVGTGIGAMEHATNIAYPHFAINGGLGNESLLAHELSHMWFGDNVTCASAEDMWLNEGWAVFADALYQEVLYGKDQYNEFIRDTHVDVIQFCHTSGGDGSYFPINQIPQEVTYGVSAYDRGATIAHSLRGYLGDDAFFDAMAGYNEYFKYDFASSYDLRDFLTGHTGIDMASWFDNWVFHSGTPFFTVDSFTVNLTPIEPEVNVFMKQKRHGPAFTGDANKVELTFMDNNWNMVTADILFDGTTGNATFSIPFAPDFIIPDYNELQCDATTDYKQVIQETGDYQFPGTYCEMEVSSVSDSALIWIAHQWAPPDPLFEPIQGLTLSDYRHWRIDGIMPEGFTATGVFWYNVSAYLDNSLITNADDSLVMLYRPSPAHNWQFIDFTKIGLWNIGKLFIENIQKGEYTLGVCDDTFVGLHKPSLKTGLHIYPNPSKDDVYIDTDRPGTLMIYDEQGRQVKEFTTHLEKDTICWKTGDIDKGTYFVRFNSNKNSILAVERVVLVK
ncbi:MAG: T9SS type A sorting domain-containing protein [Bacteroidales bacterium]|nr:T9SS type A sorting domain-containing protein [Bacteroidales bacterium]